MLIVYDGPPHTPEWFAARQEGITGTDLPKITGLSKYGNALTVYLDKRGELDPDPVGEAATWGLLLEEPVAQEWARRVGTKVTDVGVIAHPERPWMRASLDRLVDVCPDGDCFPGCALEVKTRSAYVADRWENGIPDDTLAQVAWGRMVSGLDHIHVAALIGGQRLVTHRYNPDPELETFLALEGKRVWEAVEAGDPPEVPPDGGGVLLAMLQRVYAVREGDRDLDPDRAAELVATYQSGRALEDEGKAIKTRAQTGLVQLLEDGDRGVVDGTPLFTYRAPAKGWALPAPNLKALQNQDPQLWGQLVDAGYITETSPGPRFSLTRRKA